MNGLVPTPLGIHRFAGRPDRERGARANVERRTAVEPELPGPAHVGDRAS